MKKGTVDHEGSIICQIKKEKKPEEKVEIVKEYPRGEIGLNEASRKVGVNVETLRQWITNYEAEGEGAFLADKGNRSYSAAVKEQAVREYLSGGGSIRSVSKKCGLRSTRQLRNWVKVYNCHGDFNSVKHSRGGSYMKQGRETTQAERIQIVKDCIASEKNYGER